MSFINITHIIGAFQIAHLGVVQKTGCLEKDGTGTGTTTTTTTATLSTITTSADS